MKVLENSQKIREYFGRGEKNSQKFRAGVKQMYPYPAGIEIHANDLYVQSTGADTGIQLSYFRYPGIRNMGTDYESV